MLPISALIVQCTHISTRTNGSEILSLHAPFIQISIINLYYSFGGKQNNFLILHIPILTDEPLKLYCLTSSCPSLYFHLTNNSILWKCKRLHSTAHTLTADVSLLQCNYATLSQLTHVPSISKLTNTDLTVDLTKFHAQPK